MLESYKLYLRDYFENKNPPYKIRYLDLCPTWACNSRCVSCGSYKREKTQLNWAQCEQVINYFANDLKIIIIEGGEPTLWHCLESFVLELVKYSKTKIVVITNGLVSESIKKLCHQWEQYKKQINFLISINGIGEIHNQSRGVQHAFERSIKSIKVTTKYNYKTRISFCLFEENKDYFEKVQQLAQTYRVGFNCCMPTQTSKFKTDLEWHPLNYIEYFKYQKKLKSKGLNRLKNLIVEKNIIAGKLLPCWQGRTAIHINPHGIIRPCPFDEDMEFGKVLDDRIIINESARRYWLNLIPNRCMYRNDGFVCNDCGINFATRRSIPLWLKLWQE